VVWHAGHQMPAMVGSPRKSNEVPCHRALPAFASTVPPACRAPTSQSAIQPLSSSPSTRCEQACGHIHTHAHAHAHTRTHTHTHTHTHTNSLCLQAAWPRQCHACTHLAEIQSCKRRSGCMDPRSHYPLKTGGLTCRPGPPPRASPCTCGARVTCKTQAWAAHTQLPPCLTNRRPRPSPRASPCTPRA